MPIAADDSILKRETERQRQLQQEARKAAEQKKTQLRMLDAEESSARILSIPDIRSALIPLDESSEGAGWSKPFSLSKADLEPWLSFLRGYRQSRLFPDAGHNADGGNEAQLDILIQAFLELKRLDLKILLDPAVQINRPVEYFDAGAVSVKPSPGIGSNVNASQLAKAAAKGREMGNRLYDVLLGDGYANLIKAWEDVHQRKPTVNELHLLLSSGRTKPAPPPRPRAADTSEEVYRPSTLAAVKEAVQQMRMQQMQVQVQKQDQEPAQRAAVGETSGHAEGDPFSAPATEFGFIGRWKILLYLLPVAACCGALVVYWLTRF